MSILDSVVLEDRKDDIDSKAEAKLRSALKAALNK